MTTIRVVTGQTATGKTKHAIELARQLDGELVNADSRHIYRQLDIVTGKDRDEIESSGISMHLIDIVWPDQEFSSHDYEQYATTVINDIISRGKTPILVGGSWLYIKHLLYGHTIQAPPNPKLRAALNTKTVQELQTMLADMEQKYSSTADHSYKPLNQSDSHNPHRIIRRIEILTHNQQTQTSQSTSITPKPQPSKLRSWSKVQIDGYRFGTRQALLDAISARVQKRLEQGALEEVTNLLAKYEASAAGLQTIGYKQLISYIHGECSMDQAIEEWVLREMQYAKRQYVFMKSDETITWHVI